MDSTIGSGSASSLISVVTPAHNEEAALPVVIERLVEVLRAYRHEIIIVDDGSTDGTWRVIADLRAAFPGIRAIRLTRNFGHQSAILAGLEAARGDAVIMLDSDGQHPVDLIPTLVERWREGYSVVQGVRAQSRDERLLKKVSSRLFYRVLRRLSGGNVPAGSADFRLISRPAVDVVLQSLGPLVFLRGLIPWLGFRTCYVEFHAERRVAGQPSYTWGRMLRFSVDGVMSFSIVPLRLSIVTGSLVSMVAFLYLIYIGIVWSAGRGVPGWASVAGLLSLFGGLQLLTIGVLGEYLGRLFLANLGRPHFVVQERV
jgi:glycosyltransferase involved in cell wall biosynthesis